MIVSTHPSASPLCRPKRTTSLSSSILCVSLFVSSLTLLFSCQEDEPLRDQEIQRAGMVTEGPSSGESSSGEMSQLAGDQDVTSAGEPAGDQAGESAGDIAGDQAGGAAGELAGSPSGDQAGEDGGGQAGDQGGEETSDQAGEEASGAMVETPSCEETRSKDDRLVALGFPFSEEIGVPGQRIGIYRIDESGELSAWGERIDIGFRVSSLSFSEDGWWIIALGEEGELASIDLRETPRERARTQLVSGYYSAVQRADEPRRFDIINSNNDEAAGIYSARLSCEGELSLEAGHHYLRLIQGMRRAGSRPQDAVVFGGQALFDPVDLIDLRWLRESSEGWIEISQLDVYVDFIDAINVALSPQADWVLLVNGSPFTDEGGDLHFVSVSGEPPQLEMRQLFQGYRDARGAWFLPDASAALVTQLEAGVVQIFSRRGEGWEVGQSLNGLGLAEELALTPAPDGADGWWALVPVTSPGGGSYLSVISLLSGGGAMTLGAPLIGSTASDIPGPIAAWPKAE